MIFVGLAASYRLPVATTVLMSGALELTLTPEAGLSTVAVDGIEWFRSALSLFLWVPLHHLYARCNWNCDVDFAGCHVRLNLQYRSHTRSSKSTIYCILIK